MFVRDRGFGFAVSGLLVGAFTSPAYAYLDPGTGSIILQVLLGGVAGLALAGRFYWRRFLELTGLRRDGDKPSSELKSDGPAR